MGRERKLPSRQVAASVSNVIWPGDASTDPTTEPRALSQGLAESPHNRRRLGCPVTQSRRSNDRRPATIASTAALPRDRHYRPGGIARAGGSRGSPLCRGGSGSAGGGRQRPRLAASARPLLSSWSLQGWSSEAPLQQKKRCSRAWGKSPRAAAAVGQSRTVWEEPGLLMHHKVPASRRRRYRRSPSGLLQ